MAADGEEPYSGIYGGHGGVQRHVPHVTRASAVGGQSAHAGSALNSRGSIPHRAGLDSDSHGGGGLVGEHSVGGGTAGAFLEKNNQQPLLGGPGEGLLR
jgi:hypothetical protein